MSTKNITYRALRERLDAPYFVQCITAFDSDTNNLRLVGYCVRDRMWKTMFENKDMVVCEKVCQMLNEGANNVRGT